jgi:hypothetical protein
MNTAAEAFAYPPGQVVNALTSNVTESVVNASTRVALGGTGASISKNAWHVPEESATNTFESASKSPVVRFAVDPSPVVPEVKYGGEKQIM